MLFETVGVDESQFALIALEIALATVKRFNMALFIIIYRYIDLLQKKRNKAYWIPAS